MIGPILLALSWMLLRLERRSLRDLGIDQPRKRTAEFLLGVAVFGVASALQQLGLSAAADDPFVANAQVGAPALLNGLRFVVNSVLYEELLFRGYLLYRAARWLGATRATLLSAAAFGVYHWFSYGVFGNPVAMAYVFLLTGAFGYVWARAFVVTGSVFAPIGMHFGWNAVAQLIFSAGPLGAMLLVPASGRLPIQAGGWTGLALNVGLPVLMVIGILWYFRRRAGVGADLDEIAET
jgi:uncharacterized protein